MNECGLLEVPEAGDWMDLLAVRYNVLYDNVLYYAATLAHEQLAARLPEGTPVYRSCIAADGIHSAIRRQMVPDEGEPIWNGAIMWRGTSPGRHFLGGNAMFLAGHDSQRFVAYPLTAEDPETGT